MCIEFVSFETSKTSRSMWVIIISTLYSWYVTVEVGLLPRTGFHAKREGDVRHDEGQDRLIAKTRRKDEGSSGSLSSCGFGVGWRREELRLVSGRLTGGSAPCLSVEYIPSIYYTPLQPTSSLCIDYSYMLNPEIRRDKKVSK